MQAQKNHSQHSNTCSYLIYFTTCHYTLLCSRKYSYCLWFKRNPFTRAEPISWQLQLPLRDMTRPGLGLRYQHMSSTLPHSSCPHSATLQLSLNITLPYSSCPHQPPCLSPVVLTTPLCTTLAILILPPCRTLSVLIIHMPLQLSSSRFPPPTRPKHKNCLTRNRPHPTALPHSLISSSLHRASLLLSSHNHLSDTLLSSPPCCCPYRTAMSQFRLSKPYRPALHADTPVRNYRCLISGLVPKV